MSGVQTAIHAARQVIGSANQTTINPTRTLKVYFQCWPGTDAKSGIETGTRRKKNKKVTYTFTVDGTKVVDNQKLATGGLASLPLPTNKTGTLEIFGTTYTVSHNTIEAKTTVKGQQRRLNALGYELGTPDDTEDHESDRSTLNFQADDGTMDPTGKINTATRDKLDSKVK